MSIKCNNNDSIRGFAASVQTDAAQFYGTDYKVKSKDVARRWRKGLGSDFQSINKIVDETGIIPYIWSEKLPLRQLVDKSEPDLHARGVKDEDEKNKDAKKQDGRKPHQIEKYKEPYHQGDDRKKSPLDGPPNVTYQQPDPEVENWQTHVKLHIFQHKFSTDQHLEAS